MHPYQSFPSAQFWRRSVTGQAFADIDFDPAPKFVFDLWTDTFATAGSCFAQHFGRALVDRGGRLLIADFAPHNLEHLRQQHQHLRLGFSDEEIFRWMEAGGLTPETPISLPPADHPEGKGLTVKIWGAVRRAAADERTAA